MTTLPEQVLTDDDEVVAVPASYAQQRLWFLDQLVPGSYSYNVPLALRLRGDLSPELLRSALCRVVARHETLRTTFTASPSGPLQLISSGAEVTMPVAPVAAAALPDVLRDQARRPFDLATGPLLRAHLFRLGPDEHVLSLVCHHIVVDGWSTGVLFGDLGAEYAALRRGEPSPLPPLAVQYADFSMWQRQPDRDKEHGDQLAYWRSELAGLPGLLELPVDRARPWARDIAGAVHLTSLSAELTAAVADFARAQKATPFMVLMSALQVMLARYTGQTDICVGTPVAGRVRPELEPLIGFFSNTLAIRGRLDDAPTFRALLHRIRATSLAAFDHQDVPFEQVVEDLEPDRAISHSPLFQTMFVLQNIPGEDDAHLAGLQVQVVEPDLDVAKFDLTVMAWPDPAGGLTVSYEYSTDLFDPETVQRFGANFATLLTGLLAAPDRPVTEAPLPGPAERDQLRRLGTAAPGPSRVRLPGSIDDQARTRPDAVAVEFGDHRLTYGELTARADRLARRLVDLGAGPDRLVALAVPRSVEQIVALLAILRTGAGYVPLDSANPPGRNATILADAAPVALIGEPVQGGPPALGPGDQPGPALAAAEHSAAWPAERLAYAIYTSGSTGTPKGVELPIRVLENLLTWHGDRDPGARVAQLTSIGFDVSAQEILSTLVTGGTLVIADEDTRRDPAALACWLADRRITHLYAPNLVVDGVCRATAEQGITLPHLRSVAQAGEALVVTRPMREFFAAHPDVRLHNHYGPTETHVATAIDLGADPAAWPAPVPIGRPIRGARLAVLDAAGRPVPRGARGELWLAGDILARGYLGRPAMTADRFRPDPDGPPGSRRYRTGDLVRWNTAGDLEYLGRADSQVKIRGYRIELGEVGAALVGHPGVAEAVAGVLTDAGGDRRLVAYVVPAGADRPSAAELRTYLGDVLPAYMVPVAYELMDAMPLTRNGKVDRAALPEPQLVRLSSADYVAPRGDLEELIARTWSEVLGVDRVGAHDGFFELGGHSLLATRMLARIRAATARDIPLWTIFQSPTVATFAEQIEAIPVTPATPGEAEPPLVALPRTAGEPVPAAPAQRRLWFTEQLTPGTAAYHVPAVERLHGPLDVAALGHAFRQVAHRHEVLRTVYAERGGDLVQLIEPALRLDLTAEAVPDEETARRLVATTAEHPFDLRTDHPLRVRLLRLADEEHLLVIVAHHIAFDGWSAGIFFTELAEHYRAALTGVPARLSSLPIQVADHAVWQIREQAGPRYAEQLDYWTRQLAGAPDVLSLGDRPRPAVRSMRGRTVELVLPDGTWPAVERLAAAQRATPFMVLLAAFQAVLTRYTGQTDICVGSPVAGRTRPELEPLIGFFVNTLVLRGDLSGDPTFAGLLGRIRDTCLAAFDRQDVPFEQLVERLHPARDPGSTPLFQVLFALQNAGGGETGLHGLTATGETTEATTAKFDLSLHTWPTATGGLTLLVEYSTDLFEDDSAARLAGHVGVLLAGALAAPATRLSRLPLLTAPELAAAARDARPVAEFAVSGTLPELVAAAAAARPEAIAVRDGNRLLTYAGLTIAANRLAHRLVDAGAGPGTPVGICLDRGPDLIVAVLAVLTAGSAYLPLDPAHPADRLAFVLGDAGARLVIASDRTAPLVARDGIRVIEPSDEPGRADPPRAAISPASAAYVIYTSGSTGRPKGVTVTHHNVLRLLRATAASVPTGPDDVWTLFHSAAFDFSVWEMWGALAYGGTVVIVPEAVARSPRDFADLLVRERVTVLNQTPSALRELTVELFGPDGTGGTGLALRHVVLGGEALDPADLRDWFARLGPRRPRFINMYGITETTVHVTEHEVTAADVAAGGVSPIGRPLADLRVHLLDDAMNPVPAGVPGEIWVGGPGVARGYLGRPGLTAARFVPDGFGDQPGARLYRSGDLARRDPDGHLFYLGRADEQLKVRGHRVEPGEIRAVLDAAPGVRRSAVLAHGPDRRLIAYVEPDAADAPDPAALRDHLAVRLPAPMVPDSITMIRQWPRTVNGKLDVAALPAPDTARPRIASWAAPEPGLEELVAGIWQEVLSRDRVGRHDDFFAMGGHSFLALRAVRMIATATGRRVSATSLFQAPTVAGLAAALDQEQAGGPLIDLRPGTGDPLVLIHPIGGNVLCYRELVGGLDTDRPVRGLVAAGLDGDRAPVDRIEEMAARYADAVLATSPGPDLVLGGWSMGGVIAYETARQIFARTGRLPGLVLLDSYPPEPVDDVDTADLLAAFAHDWGRAAGTDLGLTAGDLRGAGPDAPQLLHRRAVDAGLVSTSDSAGVTVLFEVFRAHFRALSEYRPPAGYTGDLTVVRAAVRDETADWSAFTTGRVSVHEVPGDHYQVLRGEALPVVRRVLADLPDRSTHD